MFQYGYDYVRGGSYCTRDLSPHTIALLMKEKATAFDLCFKCGRSGHFPIVLVDRKLSLVDEWKKAFADILNVTVTHCNDISELLPTCRVIVSPSNSFGVMDGGIDLASVTSWYFSGMCMT